MAAPPGNFALWVRQHFELLRRLCFACCLSPAIWLLGAWQLGQLGVNPLQELQRTTGEWTLIMLSLTLSVTPLRRFSVYFAMQVHARFGKRLSDWNWLIRLRRQLGLFTCFYAGLHLAVYLALDIALQFDEMWADLQERPAILLGLLAFALLVPLAATSTQEAIRRMGPHWRRLHKLVYVIALLSLAHFWWLQKVGVDGALPFTLVLLGLLALRLRPVKSTGARPDERADGQVHARPSVFDPKN